MATNSYTGNAIFNSIVVNSITTNTVSFTIPTTALNQNPIARSFPREHRGQPRETALVTNTMTVKAQPTVTLTLSNTIADAGQTETLKAQLNSGAGGGPFTINFLNATAVAVSNTIAGAAVGSLTTNTFIIATPTSGNVFNWNIVATDVGTTSPYIFNTITYPLSEYLSESAGAVTPASPTVISGQPLTLNAIPTGGTPQIGTVGTDTASTDLNYGSSGRTFSANGRYWVFYFDGANRVQELRQRDVVECRDADRH